MQRVHTHQEEACQVNSLKEWNFYFLARNLFLTCLFLPVLKFKSLASFLVFLFPFTPLKCNFSLISGFFFQIIPCFFHFLHYHISVQSYFVHGIIFAEWKENVWRQCPVTPKYGLLGWFGRCVINNLPIMITNNTWIQAFFYSIIFLP